MTGKSLFVLLFSFSLFACEQPQSADKQGSSTNEHRAPALFHFLPPERTGVDFQNALEEGLNTNILMYEYFYNGGGVACGDFNGDGLIDLYFTSNLGDNKLYINQGNLRFLDATRQSGAGGRPGPWKTGVSVADVNGDGKLDIHVCYSGALPEEKRANQLFINLGNNEDNIPIFEDQAEAYGLASRAFSTQAYFFDFDRDGDLDMLLLNHNPKNLPILNEVKTAELLKIDDPYRGIRLFRQENGRFHDITVQAGISSSELTYGLGVGVSDLNNDGWPDFYVCNDYTVPDYLYLNNGDGTFTDVLSGAMGHISHFSMGNDIADLNNDGLQDIVTLDMLPEDNRRQKLLLAPDNYAKFDLNVRSGFHYQYMRNMLQLNNGNGTFSEIGQFAGISNTDWSWAALIADFDHDGWKDIYVTNGYYRDYTNLDFIKYMDDFVRRKGRLSREDVLEIINHMPASDVANYLFAGSADLRFKNATHSWGLDQVANSNGAAYADLDNDGDLDLIVNNINQPAFIYENTATENKHNRYVAVKLAGEGLNTQGVGAKVTVYGHQRQYVLEQFPARGYQSAVTQTLHFGLGAVNRIDSLIIDWPSGKREKLSDLPTNQTLTLEENNAKIAAPGPFKAPRSIFSPVESPIVYTNPKLASRDFDRQPLLIGELSHNGPCMVKTDLNNDGLEDIFIGGAAGHSASVYLQTRDNRFALAVNPAFDADKHSEDAAAAIFDANGDGHPDIYVASGGYHRFDPADPLLQDRLYLGDGKGNFAKSSDALPTIHMSASCVAAADINQNGHMDLFVGSRIIPGRYPETPESYLLINDGKGKFANRINVVAPELEKLGMITDAAWADINRDGRPDLIVVGEWVPISIFINENGRLTNQSAAYFDNTYSGFWNTLKIADFNRDGQVDIIVGNMGTNTQFQVSDDEPAEMYHADFDRNGSVDPIFCFYIQGRSYPYVTRDELLTQLVSFRAQYTSYRSYADATITDLFSRETLAAAGRLRANHMETTLFLSTTGSKYARSALPIEAQFAPVHTINIFDFDGDGHDDLLLCGNNSRLKLRLGRLDANYGMLFKGDGKGAFSYVGQAASGLKLRGDVRSVVQVGDLFLFGINQGPMTAYRLKYTLAKGI